MKRIVLTGEQALTEEYARLCAERAMDATVLPPAGTGRSPARGARTQTARRATRPPRGTELALELTLTDRAAKRARLVLLDAALPGKTPILSTALTVSVTEQAGWITRPERLAGIGAFPTLLRGSLIELSRSTRTSDAALAAAREFVVGLGREHAVVADQAGMVLPRILCMLINEAHFAQGEGVAAAKDIDTAMMLGTNYPQGPLAWGAAIGLPNVLAVLEALHAAFGDDRYRPAPLLRRLTAEALLPGAGG